MRLCHKLYACLFGYFWISCPICHKEFGGHEIAEVFTAALISTGGQSYAVCPDPQCSYEAGVLNAARGHKCFYRATQ